MLRKKFILFLKRIFHPTKTHRHHKREPTTNPHHRHHKKEPQKETTEMASLPPSLCKLSWLQPFLECLKHKLASLSLTLGVTLKIVLAVTLFKIPQKNWPPYPRHSGRHSLSSPKALNA